MNFPDDANEDALREISRDIETLRRALAVLRREFRSQEHRALVTAEISHNLRELRKRRRARLRPCPDEGTTKRLETQYQALVNERVRRWHGCRDQRVGECRYNPHAATSMAIPNKTINEGLEFSAGAVLHGKLVTARWATIANHQPIPVSATFLGSLDDGIELYRCNIVSPTRLAYHTLGALLPVEWPLRDFPHMFVAYACGRAVASLRKHSAVSRLRRDLQKEFLSKVGLHVSIHEG